MIDTIFAKTDTFLTLLHFLCNSKRTALQPPKG